MNWFKSFWNQLRAAATAEADVTAWEGQFQNYTPRAQKVVDLARKQSTRLNRDFVGTEHLLLGLIELGQGVAFNVLQRSGLDFEAVRREVERIVGVGPDRPRNFPPLSTPRALRVFALAQQERLALQHTYLGTEHLLLGLLREGQGVAALVLKQFKVDLKHTRQEILKELDPNYLPDKGDSSSE
jgi:ATP-dependent Clp protease ATP-binding subunit ClpC